MAPKTPPRLGELALAQHAPARVSAPNVARAIGKEARNLVAGVLPTPGAVDDDDTTRPPRAPEPVR
eukprot:6214476-Lingulodinium_polyedra.AAC.1